MSLSLLSRREWLRVPCVSMFLLVAALLTAGVHAQQSAAQPAQGQTSAEKYMNIKVLKDLPASQLPDAMVFFGASLGANCGFCHVRNADGEWAFEKDDKAEKKTARQMVDLVRSLNSQFFEGKPTISCASCHQGRHEPRALTPLAQPLTPDQLALMAARGEGGRPPSPSETLDQVLAKYAQALGAAEAVQKAGSRVMRGTATNRAGQAQPVTVEMVLPDRYRVTTDGKPATTRAVDGASGWTQTGDSTRPLHGAELQAVATGIDLTPSAIKDRFPRLTVGRYDRIEGHDAINLEGRTASGDQETLSFDRASGLLIRRSVRLPTPMGRLALQIDYGDFRDVGGVKIPFEVRVTDWDSVTTEKFAEIKTNVAIDAARFKTPAPAR